MYVLGTNLSPLKEQPALLSMEPSLQTLSVYFNSTKTIIALLSWCIFIFPQIFVFLLSLFLPPSCPSHLRSLLDSQNGHAWCFLCGVSKFSKDYLKVVFGFIFFNLNSFIFPVYLLTFKKSMLVSFLLL